MSLKRILLLCTVLVAAAATAFASPVVSDLPTVAHVDLQRYLGRWYEIARYPNRFERQCDRDVTATYSMRPDGRINVLNACVKADGTPYNATGWAKVVDTATNAKLKVTFFWPFFGNYWVLELGQNYDYAVIGEPSRGYLWILSRSPQMSPEQYASIISRLAARGYDAGKLLRVKQTTH